MKLAGYGEDRLVKLLTRGLDAVGDDCAVIGGPQDKTWRLLKTDAVIEGVHFFPGEKAALVGWKALCRAISDIAAMGGEPREALITVAAHGDVGVAWMRGLYTGLNKAAKAYGVRIVGGETARSPGPLFLSVALTGEVAPKRCVRRGGGKPGDALFVTGRLGGSLRGWHLRFTPRVAQAQWLTRHCLPSAMMDLSDGLASDLPRLAEASGCGFFLDDEAVPLNKGCTIGQALRDGEDYELLFAVPAVRADKLIAAWSSAFPKLALTRIGQLTSGKIKPPADRGHDHFA